MIIDALHELQKDLDLNSLNLEAFSANLASENLNWIPMLCSYYDSINQLIIRAIDFCKNRLDYEKGVFDNDSK